MNAVTGGLFLLLVIAAPQAAGVSLLDHMLAAFDASPADVRSLARMDLDVDGDGIPEILLGLPGNQYGQDWGVYKLAGPGRCTSLGQVRFHYKAFYYDLRERRLWAQVHVPAGQRGWIQFRLTESGFVEDAPPTGRNFEAYQARARVWAPPPLAWASVPDVLAGAEAWRDLENGRDVLAPIGLMSLVVK